MFKASGGNCGANSSDKGGMRGRHSTFQRAIKAKFLILYLSLQNERKKRKITKEAAVEPLTQPSESDDSSTMGFSCKRGSIIAVYANADQDTEKRRFWIAEAATPIICRTSRDMDCSIIYYQSINEDYTSFAVEGGTRKKAVVKFSMCLDRVTVINSRNNIVNISTSERDRLTQMGKELDKEELE
tara:strand:+ start:675 stop:1229 length:555 start_codon:yes stop_codon:yes gene_type:complete